MENHPLELIRIERTEEATIGVFRLRGRFVCAVLEEPWRDNQPNISCIPEGEFPLAYEWSPSRDTMLWTIKDVPGRSYVRIHVGNSVDDTEGCPLTISYPGQTSYGQRWGFESRKAFKTFMSQMNIHRPETIIVRSV